MLDNEKVDLETEKNILQAEIGGFSEAIFMISDEFLMWIFWFLMNFFLENPIDFMIGFRWFIVVFDFAAFSVIKQWRCSLPSLYEKWIELMNK